MFGFAKLFATIFLTTYVIFLAVTTVNGSLVPIYNPELTPKIFYTDSAENAVFTWGDAMDFCQRYNMTPARVESEEENKLVTNFLNVTFTSNKWFWLGAMDYGRETRYYWVPKGDDVIYSNWAGSQIEWRVAYNCAVVDALTEGQWFVYVCHISDQIWKPRPLCQLE